MDVDTHKKHLVLIFKTVERHDFKKQTKKKSNFRSPGRYKT